MLFILEQEGWGPIARFLSLPPFIWLVELVYRFVATNRSWFSLFFFRPLSWFSPSADYSSRPALCRTTRTTPNNGSVKRLKNPNWVIAIISLTDLERLSQSVLRGVLLMRMNSAVRPYPLGKQSPSRVSRGSSRRRNFVLRGADRCTNEARTSFEVQRKDFEIRSKAARLADEALMRWSSRSQTRLRRCGNITNGRLVLTLTLYNRNNRPTFFT